MSGLNQLVAFTLDGQRYALYLSAVERVVRVVAITCLPQAPDIILGVINVQGRIIPVVNIRRRFRVPEREIALSDQLIIGRTSRKPMALVVDEVDGIVEYAAKELIAADTILPGMKYIDGVVKLKDGMILIHDIDGFLSLAEERSLDETMGYA